MTASQHSEQQGKTGRFIGHSKEFSIGGALEDAVNQAAQAQGPIADGMIEFEVVRVHGRSGGIAGFRDVWVEISVGGRGDAHASTRALGEEGGGAEKPDQYTTLAVGEEGGEASKPKPEDDTPYTTLAVGEEGGDGGKTEPYTTLAVGEEGGDGGKFGGGGKKEGPDKYTTLAVGEEGGG